MGKILFWFVVIMAILFAARMLARGKGGPGGGNAAAGKPAPGALGKRSADGASPDMAQAEAMVRCTHCGIHLPRSEAFLSDGKTWCGPDHARLGQTKS